MGQSRHDHTVWFHRYNDWTRKRWIRESGILWWNGKKNQGPGSHEVRIVVLLDGQGEGTVVVGSRPPSHTWVWKTQTSASSSSLNCYMNSYIQFIKHLKLKTKQNEDEGLRGTQGGSEETQACFRGCVRKKWRGFSVRWSPEHQAWFQPSELSTVTVKWHQQYQHAITLECLCVVSLNKSYKSPLR